MNEDAALDRLEARSVETGVPFSAVKWLAKRHGGPGGWKVCIGAPDGEAVFDSANTVSFRRAVLAGIEEIGHRAGPEVPR